MLLVPKNVPKIETILNVLKEMLYSVADSTHVLLVLNNGISLVV